MTGQERGLGAGVLHPLEHSRVRGEAVEGGLLGRRAARLALQVQRLGCGPVLRLVQLRVAQLAPLARRSRFQQPGRPQQAPNVLGVVRSRHRSPPRGRHRLPCPA